MNNFVTNTHFGTDGIRGDVRQFTYDFLAGVIDGLIAYHGNSDFSLLIGGDTRPSTERITNDLIAIAESAHLKYANLGIAPTPAINFYLGHSGFDFAIDITASHNPAASNGLKIFELQSGKPGKIKKSGRQLIEQAIAKSLAHPANKSHLESKPQTAAWLPAYQKHLSSYVAPADLSGLKIAMDCANGATSVVGASVFQELGAEVETINSSQTYTKLINDHCGSTDLKSLQDFMKQGNFDFGVAFDGDGDRCMLVDSDGRVIDGDIIIALLAESLGLNHFVTTVMANQGLFTWAEQHHIKLSISDVGDQNVYALMCSEGLSLGGEQSGHIILPGETMGDGMLTALAVAKVISTNRRSLKALASAIPTFPQTMINIPASASAKEQLNSAPIKSLISQYNQELAAQHGRLLVRPSGTEDLIRITVWGEDADGIQLIAQKLAQDLKEQLND